MVFIFISFSFSSLWLTKLLDMIRIGGITILRKGRADLISDGETGTDFKYKVFFHVNVIEVLQIQCSFSMNY